MSSSFPSAPETIMKKFCLLYHQNTSWPCSFSFPPSLIISGGQELVCAVVRTLQLCLSLVTGAPIQSTPHSTVWVILKHVLDHITPRLHPLQWLPIAPQMNPSSFPWSTRPCMTMAAVCFPSTIRFHFLLLSCFTQTSLILQPKIFPSSSFLPISPLYSFGIN